MEFVAHVPDALKSKVVKFALQLFHSIRPTLLNNKVTHYFQHETTKMWNLHVCEVLKLIALHVSKHDEIKTDGYGMALIESLVFVGLLIKDENNGQAHWKACSNRKERQVCLCLDGL